MTNENKTIPYSTLHTWIRKILDRTKCEQCGLIGKKTRGGKWNIHCANKSGKYELNIKDWLAWIILSSSWGLLPMNIALWVVYGRNYLKWKI